MAWQCKYYERNVGIFGRRSIQWIMSWFDGRQTGKLFFWGKMLNCWFIVYSNAIMKSKQLNFKRKNQELLKLKLKFMFDFPIGMEYHLKPEIKMLLNNQFQFLDGLEWLSEGKPLQVDDSFEDVEESSKNYILHSWLTPLWNDNKIFVFWLLCHHFGGWGPFNLKQCICMMTKVRKVSDDFDGCSNKC